MIGASQDDKKPSRIVQDEARVMESAEIMPRKRSKLRYRIIRLFTIIQVKLLSLLCGIYKMNVSYVEGKEGNYSKWLGPNWKAEWTRPGTIISNHVSYWDYIIYLLIFQPSFVAKDVQYDQPVVGKFLRAIDSEFLSKKEGMDQIIERQKESEEEGRSPLLIFPEWATTNGNFLIQFRKGPFVGLNSVQPVCIQYVSGNGISLQNDSISYAHFFFPFLSSYTTVNIKIYPVFRPNEYFWKNHFEPFLEHQRQQEGAVLLDSSAPGGDRAAHILDQA